MPIISAKVIKNPKKIRFCEEYRHQVLMSKPHIRLYGNAFSDDPPYVMYICLECASASSDSKIVEALEAYNNSLIALHDGARIVEMKGKKRGINNV